MNRTFFFFFDPARRPPRRRSEYGGNLVEYSLVCILIAVVCVGAIGAIGGDVSSRFSSVTTQI